MATKYNHPVGSKEYNVEKQMAYLERHKDDKQMKRWQEILGKVMQLEMQGMTYSEIAKELCKANYILRKKGK